MAVFDFPNTPAVGDIFTDPTSGAAYKWNGYAWMGGSGGSLGALVVQDAPPTSPADNSLWYESDTGFLFLRYNDGNSSQWVQLNALPQGAGYATIPYANSLAINSNRIVNGDMLFDQRWAGVASSANGYTCDRWGYVGSAANKGTWQRITGGAAAQAIGFPYYLNFLSASAYTAAAAEGFGFYQSLEGNAVSDFCWGTPNAQPVTFSFWVSSSLTGTFSGRFCNIPVTRSYPFTYSVPVANTWTKIAVTIPGDTVGPWALSGNAAAIQVLFDLGSGANLRTATANAWAAGNFYGANGTVSPVSVNASTFSITGVKLELGPIATVFPQDSTMKKYADCQRYFQKATILLSAYHVAGSSLQNMNMLPVPMRGNPTVSNINTTNCVNVNNVTLQAGSTYLWATAAVVATGGGVINVSGNLDAEL